MPTTIRRRQGSNGPYLEHKVFTVEEAAARGITMVPWLEAEVGDWAVSDDGYVVECLKAQDYEHKKKTWRSVLLTFSVGRRWVRWRVNVDVDGGIERRTGPTPYAVGDYLERGGGYGQTNPNRTWSQIEASSSRGRRAAMLYAVLYLLRRGKLSQADWDAVGLAYRPSEKIPRATARVFLKTIDGRALVAEALAYFIRGAKVDAASISSIIEQYDRLRQMAEEKGDYETALSIVDRFAKMQGLTVEGALTQEAERGLDSAIDDWDEVARQLPAASAEVKPDAVDASYEELTHEQIAAMEAADADDDNELEGTPGPESGP
ncbi:MAG: hypothetical protein AAGF99_00365 [Bacteroidota bacterium]